jgi:DNA gyrase subunit B
MHRIDGQNLRRGVRSLRRLEDLVEIAERRGVRFPDLLATRSKDPQGKNRLPSHRIVWQGGDHFAWSEEEAIAFVRSQDLRLADEAPAVSAAPEGTPAADAVPVAPAEARPVATVRELHENRELQKVFADLSEVGLSIDDFALVQEESVTGERLPARFAWVTNTSKAEEPAPVQESDDGEEQAARRVTQAKASRIVEAPNLASILESLHEIGRRGMEIKRFKGLGEMDAEQLWETTMDPTKRVLVRVTWDVASQADSLFSILMGEEVEPRRKFIEDHALEVKNLDV